MPHFPKPFFKKSRKLWYVEIDRRQIRLGADRDEAFRRYHQLMTESRDRDAAPESLAAIVDAFLDWTKKNRAPNTFEWYRYRLQRFIESYPDFKASDVRPFHVETWVDSYTLSRTSRRNYLRSVKRCFKWATKQGYLEKNPVADVEVPSADHREVSVTQKEFDELLSFTRDDALADLMIVTWETGVALRSLSELRPGMSISSIIAGYFQNPNRNQNA